MHLGVEGGVQSLKIYVGFQEFSMKIFKLSPFDDNLKQLAQKHIWFHPNITYCYIPLQTQGPCVSLGPCGAVGYHFRWQGAVRKK